MSLIYPGAAALEAELAAALIAGGDTKRVRARLAALEAEATKAAETASKAAAALQADIERALEANATMRAQASRAALAECIDRLQPPSIF